MARAELHLGFRVYLDLQLNMGQAKRELRWKASDSRFGIKPPFWAKQRLYSSVAVRFT